MKKTILVLIVVFAIFLDRNSFASADYQSAEHKLHEIQSALKIFNIDKNRFPTMDEGLEILNNDCECEWWGGRYLAYPDSLKDPWGNGFVYIFPSKYGKKSYDLYSFGRNGTNDLGQKDDITNWKTINYEYYGGITKKTGLVIYVFGFVAFILCSFFIVKKDKRFNCAWLFLSFSTLAFIVAISSSLRYTGDPPYVLKDVIMNISFISMAGFSLLGIFYSMIHIKKTGFNPKTLKPLLFNFIPLILIIVLWGYCFLKLEIL